MHLAKWAKEQFQLYLYFVKKIISNKAHFSRWSSGQKQVPYKGIKERWYHLRLTFYEAKINVGCALWLEEGIKHFLWLRDVLKNVQQQKLDEFYFDNTEFQQHLNTCRYYIKTVNLLKKIGSTHSFPRNACIIIIIVLWLVSLIFKKIKVRIRA